MRAMQMRAGREARIKEDVQQIKGSGMSRGAAGGADPKRRCDPAATERDPTEVTAVRQCAQQN